MNLWWFAITAAVVSAALTYSLSLYAKKRHIFITPIRPRDMHSDEVPRIGGIAIFITFLAVIGLILIIAPQNLSFVTDKIFGIDRNLFGVLLSALVLALSNIVDDMKGSNFRIRLLIQVIASAGIAYFGIKIQWFTNPFGGQFGLGNLDWLFVVVWVVVLTNVVNWLDNIDGLAGGVTTIALAILLFLSLKPEVNQPSNATMIAVVLGSVVGFIPFNFFRKAFLGDTGAMFLGFILAVAAIISGGKVVTVFLVLAIPFLDAAVVFFSRIASGKSPFLADKRHLTHRLLEIGWSQTQVLLVFYAASLAFGLIALNTQSLGKLWAMILALAMMTFLVGLYTVAARRQSGKLKKDNDKR